MIITAPRIGQRRMPNVILPAVPRPASDSSGGTAAIDEDHDAQEDDGAEGEQQRLAALGHEALRFVVLVRHVDAGDEGRHPARGAPQRQCDRDQERERDTGPVGAGDRLELEGQELLHLLREGRREVLHLLGDVVGVGDEPVDRDEGDQRGNEGQEGVEGHAGGHQGEVVLPHPGHEALAERLQPGHGGVSHDEPRYDSGDHPSRWRSRDEGRTARRHAPLRAGKRNVGCMLPGATTCGRPAAGRPLDNGGAVHGDRALHGWTPSGLRARAAAHGRMLPDGLSYVDSWIVDDDRLDRASN